MTTVTHSIFPVDADLTPLERAEGKDAVKVTIELHGDSISIGFEGYGEKTALPGYVRPIRIEKVDGKLRLLVWSDINEEDFTHDISLEGARENLLK